MKNIYAIRLPRHFFSDAVADVGSSALWMSRFMTPQVRHRRRCPVKGTTIGAATDENGSATILNVSSKPCVISVSVT